MTVADVQSPSILLQARTRKPIPASTSASTSTTRAQGSVTVESSDRDRRAEGPGRRWSDQDHDELIRHSEILRSIDASLRSMFGSISEQNARHAALSKDIVAIEEKLETRIRALEDTEKGRAGYERGVMQAAKDAAASRAVIISLAISLVGLIGSVVGPVIVKALTH